MKKTDEKTKRKMKIVMTEFKEGKLKSGHSKKKVKSRATLLPID